MIHERQRGILKAELVWTTRNHDYIAVMRKIRDDVGVDCFTRFTDLINYFTVPQYELKVSAQGSISVAEGAQIHGSNVGDVSGVMIKDCMFVLPRVDMSIAEPDRMSKLTDCFLECFAASLKDVRRVVFLDAIEKMTQETQTWVTGESASGLDGRLSNVCLVLCGQVPPPFDPEMRYVEEANCGRSSNTSSNIWQNAAEEAHRMPLVWCLHHAETCWRRHGG
jgi:hypothetical protein